MGSKSTALPIGKATTRRPSCFSSRFGEPGPAAQWSMGTTGKSRSASRSDLPAPAPPAPPAPSAAHRGQRRQAAAAVAVLRPRQRRPGLDVCGARGRQGRRSALRPRRRPERRPATTTWPPAALVSSPISAASAHNPPAPDPLGYAPGRQFGPIHLRAVPSLDRRKLSGHSATLRPHCSRM
jgi:hypothetical protein